MLLLCVTGIAALEALYGYLAMEPYPVSVELLPAVDLAVPNNLSVWFSSSLLAAGAILSLLIYQIRRYRTDDYRGRYRMWFWFAAILMLGSLNCVADLEHTVRTAAVHAAGIPDYSDAPLIGMAVSAFILLVLALRLAVEMRASWVAMVSLAVATACISAVLVVRVGWMWADAEMFRMMAGSGLRMLGHVALFFSLCVYASHVYREANGLMTSPPRTKRRRKKRRDSGEVESDEADSPARRPRRKATVSTKSDATADERPRRKRTVVANGKRAAQAEPSPTKRRIDKPAKPVPAVTSKSDDADGSEADGDDVSKLSKAERRRLRKQRRRELQR